MNIFDYINPLKHFTEGQYIGFWQAIFSTILQGFWARMFATAGLVLSFWFGVRRQRFIAGAIFFLFALFFAYGAVVIKLVGFFG